MNYWYGDSPILTPSGRVGSTTLLSFRDAAEAYVLELLRSFYGFHLGALRRVIDNFKAETRLRRPLLEADLYVVLGNVVLKKPAKGAQPVRMIDLAHERNLVFPELVDMIGKRVLRDRTRAPYRLYPWRLASPKDESMPVSMEPDVMSGRLVVSGTRVPVTVLIGMKAQGQTLGEIARSYHLEVGAVEKALLHIERPLHQKAA
jgi:uncharacterized protein (DUF433 family)